MFIFVKSFFLTLLEIFGRLGDYFAYFFDAGDVFAVLSAVTGAFLDISII
jgi:hypothetical protein